MGWERINGKRYFYETTYVEGKRIRKCWGDGIFAKEAAERVAKEKAQEAEDIAQIQKLKGRDMEIDRLTIAHDTAVAATIHTSLTDAGYYRHRCEWRRKKESKKPTDTLAFLNNLERELDLLFDQFSQDETGNGRQETTESDQK